MGAEVEEDEDEEDEEDEEEEEEEEEEEDAVSDLERLLADNFLSSPHAL